MIYKWDDICESREFEHDQKFVKAEHWKEACDKVDDLIKTKKYLQAENKKLCEALEFYAVNGLAMVEVGMRIDERLTKEFYINGSYAREALKEITTN